MSVDATGHRLAHFSCRFRQIQYQCALNQQLLVDHLAQDPAALGRGQLFERLAGLRHGLGNEIARQDALLIDERDVTRRHRHHRGRNSAKHAEPCDQYTQRDACCWQKRAPLRAVRESGSDARPCALRIHA